MPSAWTEHRSPAGRLYWFNAQTGTSSWERPEDLKTPAERALASTPWKEYQTAEGRKYWHNTGTKETTWTLPDAVREVIEKAAASAPPPQLPASSQPVASSLGPSPAPMQPTFVPASNSSSTSASAKPPPTPAASIPPMAVPPAFVPPTTNLPPRPVTSILHSAPVPNQAPVPMPEFKSPEDAERAFIGLLRLKGVTPSWTWEQTMRDIITEPLYKALDTLAARKAAWEKFVNNERKREKENREKNIARVRGSWNAGLDSLGEEKTILDDQGQEIKLAGAPPKLWWTWERLKAEVEKRAPDVWKLCKDDEERKVLWEDYLTELRQRDTTAANQLRGRQQEKLTNLLRAHEEKLNLPGEFEFIQWRVAQEAILQSEDFQNDDDLRKMDDLDMLIVFEEEIKRAEKEAMELKAKEKDEKRRSCRKTRAAYIQLLHELKLSGKIHADTMWKEIYGTLKDDERYLNMLGLPGSSPLELFWDIVDDFQIEIEEKQKAVEELLDERGKKISENTELDEFLSWLPSDLEHHQLDSSTLKKIFQMLHDSAVRAAKEERRRAEKRLRNQIEDFRYALKKLLPPIKLDTPYEGALERFADLSEFKVLEGQEEGRKEAYNRYMERLKEKAALEDRKTRRKDEESNRSELKKISSLHQPSDDESIDSSSKRRRKDLLDEKYHRHLSPRSTRLEDNLSSPRGSGDVRDDRDPTHEKDRERSRGRDRDHDKDRERDHALDPDNDKPRSRDRDRRKDGERDKAKDRSRDRLDKDNRDRPTSRLSTDDRDRRRKEHEPDRHSSRHHRSSRRGDRDHEDDSGKPRGSRHDDEDYQPRDKRSENDTSDKRARSQEHPENHGKSDPASMEQEHTSKRPKTDQTGMEKPMEKSDGEEGELEG